MENRFQEALDLVKPNSRLDYDYLEECSNKEEILKAYETIQELIDLYMNESKYESFAEIHKEHQEEIARLEESIKLKNSYISMLEKALDKACELIVDNFETCPNDLNKRFEYKGDCSKNCSNNETKE